MPFLGGGFGSGTRVFANCVVDVDFDVAGILRVVIFGLEIIDSLTRDQAFANDIQVASLYHLLRLGSTGRI